jgi:phenylpropionate dioxygenase-like ring-hydroxylating dioxygenase large terminal subunit
MVSSSPGGQPDGWIQIATSDEVARGSLTVIRPFARDIVVFRTETGSLAVVDAYCPHLGAHMGRGGTVVGECLECPLHAWRWDVNGKNTHRPNLGRTDRLLLRCWAVRESEGLVFVRHEGESRDTK